MNVQNLMDDRNAIAFCSGQDLAEYFLETLNEMSPKGSTLISEYAAQEFVFNCMYAMMHNSEHTAIKIIRAVNKGEMVVHRATHLGCRRIGIF